MCKKHRSPDPGLLQPARSTSLGVEVQAMGSQPLLTQQSMASSAWSTVSMPAGSDENYMDLDAAIALTQKPFELKRPDLLSGAVGAADIKPNTGPSAAASSAAVGSSSDWDFSVRPEVAKQIGLGESLKSGIDALDAQAAGIPRSTSGERHVFADLGKNIWSKGP